MYLDEPLRTYLDDLASSKSTPGGGSAAALNGAMAAGLACMVSRLTLSNTKYAEVHGEFEEILQQTEKLRIRFQELMREDIDAYGHLSACFKMPRSTSEEKAERTKAIQERLKEAALVPLEMAECAAELVGYCQRIAEIGNINVLSDIGTGTALATGVGSGAAWMVRTNLDSMKDQELVERLSERLSTALETIIAGFERVTSTVGKRT